MNETDYRIEYITGMGPGGQHRNKKATTVRITHIPTGLQVTAGGRNQHSNLRKAKKELERLLRNRKSETLSRRRKARRDFAIHNTETIRTYDFQRGTVKDHRSGKVATLKDVLHKGKLELLR